MFKLTKYLAAATITLLLSGCGFELPSSAYHSPIKTISIQTPDSSLSAQLKSTFTENKLAINSRSPYLLKITQYKISQTNTQPLQQSSNYITDYSSGITVKLYRNNKLLATKKFKDREKVNQNTTAVIQDQPAPDYISNNTQNTLTNNIFFWLISDATTKRIDHSK
jgi:hypothetical protein